MIRNDLRGPASFSMKKSRRRARGFTLVEIAIVLVIIGLLLAGILNAQSVIRNARTKDTIKAMTDMANAAQQFHDRYGAWPGTLQTAVTAIPNMTATCVGNATVCQPTGAMSFVYRPPIVMSSSKWTGFWMMAAPTRVICALRQMCAGRVARTSPKSCW